MRKLVIVSVAVVVVAAIVVLARTRSEEPKAAPPKVVRRAPETTVKATGVIKPMIGAEVRVGSRISGVVRRLFVRIGDVVEKGQPLAELDDRDLVARRSEVQAQLALAQANVEFAAADLRRKRELRGIVAATDVDLAERAYTVARQQVAGARATLDYATTQLGYARIVAPISGIVASVATQEGETVAASFAAPTFVTLLDLNRLEVWAYVDETDIGRIRTGQAARFTVDTYGDQEFTGTVTAIYPQAAIRDNVVNYVTVIRFEPPRDRVLRPEMTATVRIQT